MISEKKLESYLLDNVAVQLDALIEQNKYDIQPKSKPKKKDAENVQKKLDRLKDLYVDGMIDKEQYVNDRDKILKSASEPDVSAKQPNYKALRELIGQDFRTRYGALKEEEKRAIWRTIIKCIYIDSGRNVRFVFCD